MKKSIISICFEISNILHGLGLTKLSNICNKCEFYFPDIKIQINYENVNPFEQMSRIVCIEYFAIDKQRHEKYICREEYEYKFIFISSIEEECISKIYDPFGELIAYKYKDSANKFQFYVCQKVSKSIYSLISINCTFEELQRSIKNMTITKLSNSLPFECSQRKYETIIIVHAYQIYGKKNKCLILPINNNKQIYGGKNQYSSYFNSLIFQKADESKLNELLLIDLGLTGNKIQGINFVVLPLKLYHHFSILLISLQDKELYLLDSDFNEKNVMKTFGPFNVKPLIRYVIQLYSTCAYFMESMCIVLSKYEKVSDILNECENGIFVIKTFIQIGLMFEPENEETMVSIDDIDQRYLEITINSNGAIFKYGLKERFSNQKFFKFDEIFEHIIKDSDFPNKIDELKILEHEMYDSKRIYEILKKFHGRIDEDIENEIKNEKFNQDKRQKIKQHIKLLQNKYQLKYKSIFQSVMCMNETFKKQKSIVVESIDDSDIILKDEIK